MSNSWFQFKQFIVQQDKCAMKVSTDACIQGAWTPIEDSVTRILDIGSGTGLLSLMLAQRAVRVDIDAVELDSDAAQQAEENFAASPWQSRLKLINCDIKTFTPTAKYDLIICNPPFFQNSLLGPAANRNHARHNVGLTLNDLFLCVDRCISSTGYVSVLLPAAENEIWEALIRQNGWCVYRRLLIFPKTESNMPNRVVSVYTRLTQACCGGKDELHIYSAPGVYTAQFIELLQPFYLHL